MKTWITSVALVMILSGCGSDYRVPNAPGTVPTQLPSPNPSPMPSPSGTMSRVRNGVWGGTHSALSTTDNGATFRRDDCYSGTIPSSLTTDEEGRFDQSGDIRTGPGLGINYPARYSGRVSGNQMSLKVEYRDGSGNHAFTDMLTFGFEGPLPTICGR